MSEAKVVENESVLRFFYLVPSKHKSSHHPSVQFSSVQFSSVHIITLESNLTGWAPL